jgi:2-desacetyl-2-hydroxyethyl bacteriochlorophyllide A dehydrogenase
MKAVVLTQLNYPLEIKDVTLTDLQFGQVLVKVLVSGICGSQLHEINGNKGNGKFLPHLMGHEGCGIVQDIGPGVSTVKIGDKVVMHWRPGSGIESPFPSYILDGNSMSSGKVTTLSEYSIVSENRVTSIPEDIPNELAAMLGCSITTAFGIIDNECDLKLGESVAVIGVGGVGLNIVNAAKLKGSANVIAVDINQNKSELAYLLGADVFVSSLPVSSKIDVIIDTTGNVNVINDNFKYLSDNGRMILVGQPNPNQSLEITNALSFFNGRGLSIKATQGGMTNPDKDIPRYISLYKSGLLDVADIVTHRFDLSQINEAFDLLKSGNAGRIIVEIGR